jgi:1,4-alpha-glucan branching enzyme
VLLGDFDLHLFGEGRHRRLWEVLGAVVVDPTTTRVAVWAPSARRVEVVGDWNAWQGDDLERQGTSGVWAAHTAARPGQCYKFRVTGADGRVVMKADPMARAAECPPKDASVVAGPSTYPWIDSDWCAARPTSAGPLRIYEVHLGSWRSDLRTYGEVAAALAEHVAALGFTHVELLPIAEHPYSGSWGYQVTGYYAPTARFGSPDDFRAFVDTLHAHGVGVILDWVPAHFPRDEWALARFDGTPLYEHADPRRGEHPDWGTFVFDYGRPEVRNFLVANALYWFDEFHIDGLRVDAVASMLYLDYSRAPGEWAPNELGGREDLDAVELLRQVTTAVRDEFPGALLVAEESTAWPGVSHPVSEGGLGFTHKWNMGWMHDTLHYLAKDAVHRRWHHHELTFGLLYAFSERYVMPLSHDEVVHGKGSLLAKMVGDDWQRFAALRALYGWMWALPGAPLVFMGSELAPWSEWNDAGSLPWHLLEHPAHRGVRDLLQTLNEAADTWPAVWERDDDPAGFEWLDADDTEHSVYAFVRWAAGGQHAVVCLANFTPVPRPGYRVGLPWLGEWTVVVDTDAAWCGGSGYRGDSPGVHPEVAMPWQGYPVSAQIDLPPLGVVWLAAHRPVVRP